MRPELTTRVAIGLKKGFPAHAATMGEVALHQLAALAVARATHHHAPAPHNTRPPLPNHLGPALAQDCLSFAATMVMLGSGFETDRLVPWAAEILAEEGKGTTLKIQALLRAALDWTEQTGGPRDARLASALQRIQAHPFMRPPLEPPDDTALLVVIDQLDPERVAATPPGALALLPGQARALASHHGIDDDRAPAMFAVLLFMLGHQFNEDPQYPWAKHALTTPLEDGVERVWRLYADAMVYVGRLLATAKREG